MFGIGKKDSKESELQYDPKSGNYRTQDGEMIDGDVFAEAVSELEREGASHEEAVKVASQHYQAWPEDGR